MKNNRGSILEAFASGDLSTDPHIIRHGSDYVKILETMEKAETKLLALLNDDEKELLQEYTDAQAKISDLDGVDRFVYGYRLGVLMTMEVFEGKENLITGGIR